MDAQAFAPAVFFACRRRQLIRFHVESRLWRRCSVARCPTCGAEEREPASYSNCGAHLGDSATITRKNLHWWLLLVCVLLGFLGLPVILGSLSDSSLTPPSPKDRPGPPGGADDASLLIARCGQPSLDDSTAYDDPRPTIPSRWIEYKNKRLRFVFVPGFGAKRRDPPPYRWKLVGITDTQAKQPAKARVVMPEEALKRMPCWSGK